MYIIHCTYQKCCGFNLQAHIKKFMNPVDRTMTTVTTALFNPVLRTRVQRRNELLYNWETFSSVLQMSVRLQQIVTAMSYKTRV